MKMYVNKYRYIEEINPERNTSETLFNSSYPNGGPLLIHKPLDPDEDGNTVVQDCAWIAKNPNAIDDRREKYCFSSDDCTKASDIGDHCPEACGLTEGLHLNKSC